MWDGGSEGDQDAGEVDGQDPVPVVEIEIGERSCRYQDACVCVHDPQRPELAHECIDGRGERVGVGDVGPSRRGAPAGRAYLLNQGAKTVAVEAYRGDVGTFARRAQGSFTSDATLR